MAFHLFRPFNLIIGIAQRPTDFNLLALSAILNVGVARCLPPFTGGFFGHFKCIWGTQPTASCWQALSAILIIGVAHCLPQWWLNTCIGNLDNRSTLPTTINSFSRLFGTFLITVKYTAYSINSLVPSGILNSGVAHSSYLPPLIHLLVVTCFGHFWISV